MFCIITFVRIAAGAPPPYAGRVKKPAAHAPNIYFDFFTEFLYAKRQAKSIRHDRIASSKANIRFLYTGIGGAYRGLGRDADR